MSPLELGAAGAVLLATLALGTLAHEFAHAAVLRAVGVPFDLSWRPGRGGDADGVGTGFATPLATVTPRPARASVRPWRLRLAALAPLGLALPAVAVLLGAAPDPVTSGSPVAIAATVGWLACALPSPQDFAWAFDAERLLAEAERAPTES